MQKMSLPVTLQLSLQQHAAVADISDDEELRSIITRLGELNEKVEAIKLRARQKKQQN